MVDFLYQQEPAKSIYHMKFVDLVKIQLDEVLQLK